MKVSIEVEQYDNGISLKWSNEEAVGDNEAVVALDADKESAIGKMIWSDVRFVMDNSLANKVRLTVEYEPKEVNDD